MNSNVLENYEEIRADIIYNEGFNAFCDRIGIHMCPYENGRERKLWIDGWTDAELELTW